MHRYLKSFKLKKIKIKNLTKKTISVKNDLNQDFFSNALKHKFVCFLD
jgi:hypothetical protein